ncbi:PREDICTED: protein transport protein Sec31A-like, partial [Priapulus caudatus]|uniref:Protein transport protein Sec31A-like n=1 Tax=Priapulus caudatus TaxID=37621 RepID=A0ABM1EUV5_PRICU
GLVEAATRSNIPSQLSPLAGSGGGKSLLTGNLEAAVDLCLRDDRVADAIVLAIAGGQRLLQATQERYFAQHRTTTSKLISSIVRRDWKQIVSCCALSRWKEALAAVLTYASPDELSALCGSPRRSLYYSRWLLAAEKQVGVLKDRLFRAKDRGQGQPTPFKVMDVLPEGGTRVASQPTGQQTQAGGHPTYTTQARQPAVYDGANQEPAAPSGVNMYSAKAPGGLAASGRRRYPSYTSPEQETQYSAVPSSGYQQNYGLSAPYAGYQPVQQQPVAPVQPLASVAPYSSVPEPMPSQYPQSTFYNPSAQPAQISPGQNYTPPSSAGYQQVSPPSPTAGSFAEPSPPGWNDPPLLKRKAKRPAA